MNPKITIKDLSSYAGDGLLVDVFVTDAVTGNPIDLTGSNTYFTAKRGLQDNESAAIVHVKTGDPTTNVTITVSSPTSGHIQLQIHAAATSLLPIGMTYPLFYDVKVDSGSNTDPQTVQRGVWTVNPSVTTA